MTMLCATACRCNLCLRRYTCVCAVCFCFLRRCSSSSLHSLFQNLFVIASASTFLVSDYVFQPGYVPQSLDPVRVDSAFVYSKVFGEQPHELSEGKFVLLECRWQLRLAPFHFFACLSEFSTSSYVLFHSSGVRLQPRWCRNGSWP